MKNSMLLRLVALTTLALFSISCGAPGGMLFGSPPKPKDQRKVKSETFNPKIDILFVIDNSGSMDSHQNKLASNVNLFTTEIYKSGVLDFHIGVTTTTADSFGGGAGGSNGTLYGSPKYVEKSTLNGPSTLARNMLVGTSGSGDEMMFDPIYMALTPPNLTTQNAGFYRQDAHLAIIFITDAEDHSRKTTGKALMQMLLNLKGGRADKILAYGAIIPHNDKTNCTRDDGSAPLKIEEFIDLAKGKYYGLCDVDYGVKLAGLAADIVRKAGRYIYLASIPKPETILVTYGTQMIANDPTKGWMFDSERNAIVLGDDITWSKQPTGTAVEVAYDSIDTDPEE